MDVFIKSKPEEEPTQLRGYQHTGWNQVRAGAKKDYIKRSFQASILKNYPDRKIALRIQIIGSQKNFPFAHALQRPMGEDKSRTTNPKDLLLFQ